MSTPVAWRVYVQDWIVVYTSDAVAPEGQEEAQRVFAERWAGRVEEGDFTFQFIPSLHVQIWLRIPVLQGEWRAEPDAEAHAQRIRASEREVRAQGLRLPGLPEIVESGSAEERALLDYGKKKLRADS